jgi:uncharacterized protein YkwD
MAARLVVVAVVIVLLVPANASAGSGTRSAERAMIDAINDARRAYGLRALKRSRWLQRSAGGYAHRLMSLDVFGHRGSSAGGRATRGEALAMHRGWRPQARRTMRRWMRSPSHVAVLLDRRFRRAGAGLSRGRFGGRPATIWVLRVGS